MTSTTSTVGSFEHPLILQGVQHLLSSIEDGIFVLDDSLRIVYFNQPTKKHLYNFYGFLGEVGQEVMPLLPEERRGPLLFYFTKVLNGESIRYTQEIAKIDAPSLWVECHYFPLKNVEGKIIGVGGTLKDISERQTYRIQLEDKSKELGSILQSITDGFFTLDRQWIIRYANRQAATLVGLTPEAAIGKNIKELFPSPSTLTFFTAYEKAFETGLPVSAVDYYSPLDKWLDVSIYPSNDLLTIYARDVTEKRKLEEQLLQLKLSEQKTVIAATIQGQEKERELLSAELHDNVSQVLTTTKLYLEMAAEQPHLNAKLLKKSIENLSATINDLRLISYSLLPSTLNDIGVVDSINELIQPYIAAKKFRVAFSFNGDLHLLSTGFKVNLFRIIQDQLHNIAIHTGASNVWLRLETGEQLTLTMNDNGKSMFENGEMSMATIRNRTELYDGTAHFSYASETGNRMFLSFPMASCC
jgi:PAS domain S-box-containing protein